MAVDPGSWINLKKAYEEWENSLKAYEKEFENSDTI